MIYRAWIALAVIFSLFSVGQVAVAAEINTATYDIYVGDINSDGYNDYFVTKKPKIILLHGDIVIPITVTDSDSFLIQGNNANYSVTQPVVQSYTLSVSALAQKISQGSLRLAVEGTDFYLWNDEIIGQSSIYLPGIMGTTASLLIKSYSIQNLPVIVQTYPVAATPSLTIASSIFNSNGNFRVFWTKVANSTRYELFENNNLIQSTADVSINFSGVTARQPGNYVYQVRACNTTCGALSNLVTITVGGSSSGGGSSGSSSSSSLSSSSSAAAFDFNSQAPANFKYSTSVAGTPALGSSQFVATTQGDMSVSNGVAQYSVKIDLPPAVRNLKPSLALSYNSRSGNGLMGVGWSLSGISSITRCRATFASDGYSGGNDHLCLDGQKLVVANGSTYWAVNATYKTETDNFSKIQAFGGNGGLGSYLYFKVWTKDGRILTYGSEESAQNSRIQKGYNPVDTWALDKVDDAYGNSYTITYQRNNTDGEYYPDRINFGPDSAVVFKYQTRAGQTPWGYEKGAKYKKTKVLDTVTTYINVASPSAPETGTPVKKYDVNYKLSAGTQRELVDTISECGYQAGTWTCAKPLTFSWQAGEFGFDEATPHYIRYCSGADVPDVVQFIDIDGDGYNDALQKKGIAWGTANSCFVNGDWVTAGYTPDTVQPLMTKGGYAFLIKQTNTSANPNVRTVGVLYSINKSLQTKSYIQVAQDTTQTGGLVTADLSGDGLDDFIYNGKNYTQQDTAVPAFASLTIGIGDADKHKVGSIILDMSGNGIKQEVGTYVNYGPATQDNPVPVGVYVGNGDFYNGWSFEANQTQLVSAGQSYYAQPIKVSGGLYRVVADINGDGNKDFIFNHVNKASGSANYNKGEWLYRLNLQTGGVGPEVNTQIATSGFSGSSVHLTNHYSYAYDYDKDGREDLLAVIPTGPDTCQLRVLLARDQSGEMKFEEAQGVVLRFLNGTACTPVSGDMLNSVFSGDANNDGIQDVRYLDKVFYGKLKQPDMLVKVTDGFDADINVEYSPLTGDTNNAKALYTPDTTTPIFPQAPASRGMQVVKKLSVSNGQGGYNSRFYNYTGAKMDLQGRGFLGFANIEVTDVASGVVTTTDYRQTFPYTGRIDTVTTKTIAGDLISSTKNVYAIHSGNSRFPYVDYTLKKTYELTTTDLNNPVSATKVKNTYDTCGTQTEQIVETGTGVSAATITGILGRVRMVNEIDYATAACNDDFVFRTTKEASKTSTTDDLRTTVTEFEPNAAREVAKIIAFKGTALQKTTVISRAANGVVTGSTETASDIDSGTTTSRVTSSSDFTKGIYPQTITNELSSGNHVTTVGYDYRFGVESSVRTPDLQTTNRIYDFLGRLVQESGADGTRSEIISFYCSSAPVTCPAGAYYGVATKVTNDSLANTLGAPLTIVYYDKLQREVRRSIYSMDGKAINTDTQYRTDGKLLAVSEPFVTTSGSGSASYWTTYSNYDALGRARTVTGPDGGSKTTLFEKSGNLMKVTDTVNVIGPRSSSTQITQRNVNALGQVVKVTDANTTPVDYTYNSTGNLATTLVNSNTNTLISIAYDSQGNKSRITDPDAGVIDFDYNGFGELRRQIWQKDVTLAKKSMVFTYDQLGRQLSRVDQPNSGNPTTYTWLWDTKQKGKLTSESGNSQTVTYGYDGLSRLSTATTSITGLADRTFTYGYDNFSRPTSVAYPNGFKISRQYHAAGMAVQTSDITDSVNPKILWALGNDLDARGNFSNQLWGNGVVTQTGFDGQSGQIKTIKTGKLTSTSLSNLPGDIQALGYEYDTLGNLQTRTSQRTNAAGTALENLREEFVYDKLNRLKTSTTSGLFVRTNDYVYDELGNLTNRSSKLGSSSTNDDVGTLSYDRTNNAGVHAVTAAGGKTYQYDKYGNMTKRGNETIEYDVFNKPVRISGTTITTMDYDANHERFREVSGSTVTYTFVGGLYEEVVEGGKTTQKSYVDGVILNTKVLNGSTVASNDTQYLHTDNLGSVEAISNKLGNFVSRMSFSDWGKRQQSDWKTGSPTDIFPTNNGYTGHDQMDQHSLVHMGGRVYDPGLGRFLSADLFVQSPESSQSFNRYTYVSNNPLSRVDPTGYVDGILIVGCQICQRGYDTYLNDWLSSSRGASGPSNTPQITEEMKPNLAQQQLDTLAEKIGATQEADGAWILTDKKGNGLRFKIEDKNGKGVGFKITDKQRKLASDGDRKGFWKSRLEDSGDPMGKIGLKAVKNEGGILDYLFGGQAINHRLQAFARVYGGGDLDLNAVGIKLMNAHIRAVEDDKKGTWGLLSPGQIASYHHDVFAGYKLPPTAFGGTPFTGGLWEASATSSIWCRGCDTQ